MCNKLSLFQFNPFSHPVFLRHNISCDNCFRRPVSTTLRLFFSFDNLWLRLLINIFNFFLNTPSYTLPFIIILSCQDLNFYSRSSRILISAIQSAVFFFVYKLRRLKVFLCFMFQRCHSNLKFKCEIERGTLTSWIFFTLLSRYNQRRPTVATRTPLVVKQYDAINYNRSLLSINSRKMSLESEKRSSFIVRQPDLFDYRSYL